MMLQEVIQLIVCECCGLKLKQLGENAHERVLNALILIRNTEDRAQQQEEAETLLKNLDLFDKSGYDVDSFIKLVTRFS